MKLLRGCLILLLLIASLPLALVMAVRSMLPRRRRPPAAVTPADVAKAERSLGFALPHDLQAVFQGPRGALSRRGADLYTPSEAAREYREITRAPYGPNGEEWPRNLFPFADFQPGYACYDLDSGRVVEWDPEEIAGGNESKAAWRRSFVRTELSLADWLKGDRPAQ